MAVKREEIVASAASITPSTWVGRGLWLAVLAWWGLADLATTWYGMEEAGTYEDMPLAAVIEAGGHLGHVAFKLFVFGVAFVYYQELPEIVQLGEWLRLAIPAAFVLAGMLLSIQNVEHVFRP